MGIVSEILPVFARKPLFGYQFVVFSGIAIGFIGFGVWAHHMFAVGLGPVANTAFAVSTMIIAIPTGVKIFNWLGTLWNGDLRFATPMLFSIGFIAMFVIGGLSGVTHAVVPSDYQQTDTYYIVAHFHYVLFGGAIFGLFAGMYYWWPKVFGRMLSETGGKLNFWLMLIGFNMTFGPMHILGLQGMPRRIQSYPASLGLSFWNMVSSIGAFVIAISVLVFLVNAIASFRKPKRMEADPGTPDPRVGDLLAATRVQLRGDPGRPLAGRPVAPQVRGDRGRARRPGGGRRIGEAAAIDEHAGEHGARGGGGHAIHMPSPSYFPLIAAGSPGHRLRADLRRPGRRGGPGDHARRLLRVGPGALVGVSD